MISEAQKKATAKYEKKNYDFIYLRVRKGQSKLIREYAEKKGKSLNRLINELLEKEIGEKFQCLNYDKKEFEE